MPHQVDQMTLSEITVVLSDRKNRAWGGRGRAMSGTELDAEIERWEGLTPREQLEEALAHGD